MRTADGHQLRLPDWVVDEVMADKPGARRAAAEWAVLAGRARHTGRARIPESGKVFERFTVRQGEGIYELLATPLAPGQGLWAAVRARPASVASELEAAPLALRATITWRPEIYTLAWSRREGRVTVRSDSRRRNRLPRRGGIYIAEKRFSGPVYVGQAGNLQRRWRNDRLAVFRELKLSTVDWSPYRIRIGEVRATSLSGKALREAVEKVLVRYLMRLKKKRLSNSLAATVSPFRVLAPGILVRNGGSRPSYLPETIRRDFDPSRPSRTFELLPLARAG